MNLIGASDVSKIYLILSISVYLIILGLMAVGLKHRKNLESRGKFYWIKLLCKLKNW